MKGLGAATAAIAAATWFAASAVAQVDPIVIKGSKFFYKSNGTEFFIRGVAYQQDFTGNGSTTTSGSTGYTDPLADASGCQRDVPLLQKLQTNTIRVYAVDPTKDHSQCMQLLQDAGIYVVLDLGEPDTSVNRDTPAWNQELYDRYATVIDSFANYTNTLGFFAGNEVSNAPNNTQASAFVKAAVRDMKAYIVSKKYRPLGVGYASDDDETRTELANYFNCGPAQNSIDFWGYNIYSWCGKSSYSDSKYDVRTEEFSTYNVPAFFAEYGCNKVEPRPFDEVAYLFGSNMTKVWSGGIVYMYFQEANDYGLVTIGSDKKATTLTDFDNLSTAMASVKPSGPNSASYSPTNSPQACPTTDTWKAATALPPTPNEAVCNCMVSNLTCVAKSSLSDDDVTSQFDYICNPKLGNFCSGVNANGSTGKYGAYSMCSANQRLSFAFNQYYLDQTATNTDNNNPCEFSGAASTVRPKVASSCTSIIDQAGAAGTGTITNAPSVTGKSSSTGSGGGSSSSSSKGAAVIVGVPEFDFGILKLAGYLVSAMLVGAGVVLY
ncbi:1,3-beta-glucanosyltransferase gas1 [Puttea exsequens]|nr:1,3-beta-glucanosyltransferase gas1 [Puttea exsequens]